MAGTAKSCVRRFNSRIFYLFNRLFPKHRNFIKNFARGGRTG